LGFISENAAACICPQYSKPACGEIIALVDTLDFFDTL
jgi:hypothetical protein